MQRGELDIFFADRKNLIGKVSDKCLHTTLIRVETHTNTGFVISKHVQYRSGDVVSRNSYCSCLSITSLQ